VKLDVAKIKEVEANKLNTLATARGQVRKNRCRLIA